MRKSSVIARLLLAACVGLPALAAAQTATLYGGFMERRDSRGERTHSVAVEYREPLHERLGFGLLYLNEGHPDSHHRDGFAGQLWLHTPRLPLGLQLGAGAGPYYFFDTVDTGGGYFNEHGWGMIYSLLASVPFTGRWSAHLRWNRVDARGLFDTHTLMLGVGYTFAPRERAGAAVATTPRRNEITLLAGQTILNSFASERATALSVEYRRTAATYADWTLTLLNEGEPQHIDRRGIAAQAWLARSVNADRARFGLGLGPYFAVDRRHADLTGENERRVAALVSASLRYRLPSDWHIRGTWHRVLADYHRDTDVLLIGAGYTF